MSDFEQVLDDCLRRLTSGTSTLDECLSGHPEHASQLNPLLQSAVGLMRHSREVYVSPAFKARGRAKLSLYVQDRPRQRARKTFMFRRFAASAAVLVLALLSAGTVRAQSALPGDLFYAWKLASEGVWREISPDASHVDLVLANRRISEIVATADDPTLQAVALHDYEEILARLQSGLDVDSDAQILSVLESHRKSLKDAGLSVPQLDDYLSPEENDGEIVPDLPQTPTVTPPVLETPQTPAVTPPVLEIPQIPTVTPPMLEIPVPVP